VKQLAGAIRRIFKRTKMQDEKTVEWSFHPGDSDPIRRGEIYTLGLSRHCTLPTPETEQARAIIGLALEDARAEFALTPAWQLERHLTEVIRQTQQTLAEVEAKASAAAAASRTALMTGEGLDQVDDDLADATRRRGLLQARLETARKMLVDEEKASTKAWRDLWGRKRVELRVGAEQAITKFVAEVGPELTRLLAPWVRYVSLSLQIENSPAGPSDFWDPARPGPSWKPAGQTASEASSSPSWGEDNPASAAEAMPVSAEAPGPVDHSPRRRRAASQPIADRGS
jgi:hypothetical protein